MSLLHYNYEIINNTIEKPLIFLYCEQVGFLNRLLQQATFLALFSTPLLDEDIFDAFSHNLSLNFQPISCNNKFQ